MKKLILSILFIAIFSGCASNVKFMQTDSTYEPESKPDNANIVFTEGKINRPHSVIGVISAELGKDARNEQLDALMIEKARDIGADGIMQVEYDVDRNVYTDTHHDVVGRGRGRHHVVKQTKHVDVKKTASGIAVIFE